MTEPPRCLVCRERLQYVMTTNEKKPVYRDSATVDWEYVSVYRCRNHGHGRFWVTDSEGVQPEPT